MNTTNQAAAPRSWLTGVRCGDYFALLTVLIAFVSAGLVQKYAGLVGVTGYTIIVGAALWVTREVLRRWGETFDRYWLGLLITFGLVLLGGFVVTHPLEDGRGPGLSSDRDEGLEMAVTRMASGMSPYYPSNTTAGPLSVLPGGIMLSAPFVAMGNSGYQNIFWLLVLAVAGSWWLKDRGLGLMLPGMLLASSPSMLYEFVSGGDLIANGIYVPVAMGLCVQAWTDGTERVGWRWCTVVLVGVVLASRPNFLLLLPLLGGILWRTMGVRRGFGVPLVAGLVAMALIVPFYLNDPQGFTPWIARKKLAVVDQVLPWAGQAMIGITVVAALVGAWRLLVRRDGEPLTNFFRCGTWVMLCPMLCAVAMQSWVNHHIEFGFMRDRFGLMYLVFAVLGYGGSVLGLARANSRNEPTS